MDLAQSKILVTGGTGSIGGRLLDVLAREGHKNVRVLVRDLSRALRIARFPFEFATGNLTSAEEVARAVDGCDVIFHCAYGNSGSEQDRVLANVEGTRNVLEAAARAGVKRVVHLSTVMVYGVPPDGDLDETFPRRPLGMAYADSKLEAEELVAKYCRERSVPATVLQLTAVYGPNALWTVDVLQWMKRGRVILVNGGSGLRNAVYIDDVVSAMLHAAVEEGAVGESFLISGETPVTYSDFYERYERMLGRKATLSMSAEEAEKYYAQKTPPTRKARTLLREGVSIIREDWQVRERLLETLEARALANVTSRLMPGDARRWLKRTLKRAAGANGDHAATAVAADNGKPPIAISPSQIRFFAARPRVRIDKAKRLLHWQPQYDLDHGMEMAEQWARWANLIP